MARLGDVCTKITDGSHNPPQGIPHSEYLMLSSKNIYDDEITLDDPRFLSAENYAIENKRTQIATGDILLTIVGTVGRAAVVSNSTKNICLQRSVAVIKPNSSLIDSRFLMYQLQSMRTHLEQEARGVAQKGIYLKQVENLQVKIPSMDEQCLVVKKLDKVGELITLRKEQLAKLDQLVKSRFIELFIGKGYPTKTVDEVSLGKGEYGAQSASSAYDPTRPRYVRITDINDDGTLNEDVVSSVNFDDDEQYKLEYGDFMFARMGATVGKTYAFIEGNQIFAGYLIRYRLNKSLINPRYLFWYTKLDEYWNWVKLNQSGAAQPGINAKKYGSLQIPLPPIEEQNAFAAFVEQTDKSKLAIQQSLDKLELLKKSLMQEYFG